MGRAQGSSRCGTLGHPRLLVLIASGPRPALEHHYLGIQSKIVANARARTGGDDRVTSCSAPSTDPKSVPLQISYARLLLQKGNYDKAQAIVKDLNKSHSKSPQVENMTAILLMHDGKIRVLKTAPKAVSSDRVAGRPSYGTVDQS